MTMEEQKQMGCMAGFFQLFDRNHILAGKRFYSTTKRLTSPPFPVPDSPAEPEKPKQNKVTVNSAAPEIPYPVKMPTKSIHITELKGTRSAWKFGKEAPRLSLDSRTAVDARGKLYPKQIRPITTVNPKSDGGDEKRRSTSVIARLMGLEPLSENGAHVKEAELRRSASASESKISRDQSRFMNLDRSFDNTSYLPNITKIDNTKKERNVMDPMERSYSSRPWKSPQQRRNYFDSEDFFPEPKLNTSIYNEIERRLRVRGIDEPCKDLETLKQILEAMQLKGLLHNKRPKADRRNNYIYGEESPIAFMKPARSRAPLLNNARSGTRQSIISPRESPQRERPRNTNSPTRRDSSAKNSPNSSPMRRRPLGIETQKRTDELRRASPVNSPRMSPRRIGSDQTVANNRSPQSKRLSGDAKEKIRPVVIEDESSSITESTVSTSSHTESERSKMEEYKGGKSLLDRCDKLLNCIAEMTANELQPSPVSVLDSSFYKDESSSPSPIMKRSINFKDHHGECEEDLWSPALSPIQSKRQDATQDCDYAYISDILRACHCLPEDSDVFLLLEKKQYLKGNDSTKVSRLQRKLIFDTINEILDRKKQLPPWKLPLCSNSGEEKPSLSIVWLEFQKIRERDLAEEDLFDTICSVLRKDLAGDSIYGWGDCHVEMSEAVLDIERLIFKDLFGETIQELSTLDGNKMASALCRKLVF